MGRSEIHDMPFQIGFATALLTIAVFASYSDRANLVQWSVVLEETISLPKKGLQL